MAFYEALLICRLGTLPSIIHVALEDRLIQAHAPSQLPSHTSCYMHLNLLLSCSITIAGSHLLAEKI